MGFLEEIWLFLSQPCRDWLDRSHRDAARLSRETEGQEDPHSDRLKWEWPIQDLGGSD